MAIQKNLEVKKSMVSGIDAISVVGAFDAVDTHIDSLIDEIIGQGKKDIVFDFNDTSYLTSSGIAVLIKALRKIQAVNGTLYISNITQDMYELLSTSSLNRFLKYI